VRPTRARGCVVGWPAAPPIHAIPCAAAATAGRPDRSPCDHNAVRILMVASEAQPFAKTGGLADVLGALPRALARLGHDVDVVMPKYRGITAGTSVGQITVTLGGQVD